MPAGATALTLTMAEVDPARLHPLRIVAGGERRQDSVANAFDHVDASSDVVLIHDAARPFVTAGADRSDDRRGDDARRGDRGAAVARYGETGRGRRDSRDDSPRDRLSGADAAGFPARGAGRGRRRRPLRRRRDRRSGARGARGLPGARRRRGSRQRQDHDGRGSRGRAAADGNRRPSARALSRVGTGYDLHRLVEGRPLVIGGVTIPSDRGALAHSDGDVACHAATDAILGAASLGDIGRHFPDTDPSWKDADSLALLREAARLVHEAGFDVVNLDVTVILERPKIKDAISQMCARLADALGIDPSRVSVKGKTNEGVDAVGRGEAIAAHAVALLRRTLEPLRRARRATRSRGRRAQGSPTSTVRAPR